MLFRRIAQSFPVLVLLSGGPAVAQEPVATFKAGVDLVSVSAVVRDKNGKVVRSLGAKDFIVAEDGKDRRIMSIQSDANAPASIAFLVDSSGSMALGTARKSYRHICDWVLATLNQQKDDAALLSFDTRLITLREFTGSFEHVRTGLDEIGAWGATSIYDAIAGTSARVADRARNRRAVIVLTDGADNWSSYTAQEVAWIASTIDVPVYVFAVGDGVNAEAAAANPKAQYSPLADLARATGGDFFVANSPALAVTGITRLVDELRHQYLIAFEPSSVSGMRRIEIRTKKRDLRVNSRKWYAGGASNLTSAAPQKFNDTP
ncbi:MAG TPA: VWA domain-containing protein [Vicinamibacterales bacterium]|nr:VWA domain-containing protein [Vicinamibacterales bacterium]